MCEAIAANPALGPAVAGAAQALCDAGWMQFWPDDVLILGAPNDVQVVLSGVVSIGTTRADGTRVVINYTRPQEIIGIVATIDGRGSMHDHRAHGTATVFHFPRAALLAQFERDPALLRGILDLLCERSRLLYSGIDRMALYGIRTRLADRLLMLAAHHGRPAAVGVELGIRLSQEDLAAMLATSRQSVNRELRRFAAEGVIHVRYSRLTVLDAGRLQEISREEEEAPVQT